MSEANKLLARFEIHKRCRVYGTSSKAATDVFSFPGPDGRKRIRVEMPPSKLMRLGELESALLDRGVELPSDPGDRKELLLALRSAKARKSKTRLSRSGWTKKRTRFSAAGRVIGASSNDVLPYVGADGKATYAFIRVAGTSAQWKKDVAAFAVCSAIMIFLIGTVFAAPLLIIMGFSSYSFNIFGKTRCGKSLAFLVAASPWSFTIRRPYDLGNDRGAAYGAAQGI